jgi:hypothetical protein
MRKLLLVVCLLGIATFVKAAWWNSWENVADIQVSTTNSPAIITNPAYLFVDRPDKGQRDCFTKLSFSGDNFPAAGVTINMISASSSPLTNQTLANGTTFYNLTWTTGTVMDYWDFQNPLCSPLTGTTTWITVSTGNYKVNATGFIRNK